MLHNTLQSYYYDEKKKGIDKDKPYIKKPLNSFMLFRAEQSQKVAQELHITNAIKVNTVLGQRWKEMSEQQQAPYFEKARRARRAHEAKYPGWSPKDNIGRKTKKWNTDQIPVPPNQHSCQGCSSQNNQKPFQKLLVETSIINGVPVVIMPLENFLNQAHENQVSIEVLPTSVSPFQDLSEDLAPDDLVQELPVESVTINGIPIQCNPYKVFRNMAPEVQAAIQRLLDQTASSA
ncbi:protein pop-1-like [Eucyclogobius newberryi]|uniref:protein pop-1-like n=1 Tax=Eucyclogobius newberryi TaxID=166745 RepID=UPI003B5BCE9D